MHTRTHTHTHRHAHTHTHTLDLGRRPSIWMMPFCHEAVDWIMIYQRGGFCDGCLGRVVIRLCRAMSWLRRKDRLHVSQIKGCQEVSPSAGCSPIPAALIVALLCSSSCSLILVLLSRPLCHFCLNSALSSAQCTRFSHLCQTSSGLSLLCPTISSLFHAKDEVGVANQTALSWGLCHPPFLPGVRASGSVSQ